jgi:hypothetical protein
LASKQRKNRTRKAKSRSQSQRTGGRVGLKTYGLIMGVVALAVIVVAAIAILDQGRRSPTQSIDLAAEEVSLDKSKGAADASVVVVEYGDFQ